MMSLFVSKRFIIRGLILLVLSVAMNTYAQSPLEEVVKGEKDGNHKEYYSNGQLRLAFTMKNGALDGVYESYYRNGAPYAFDYFEDGIPVDTSCSWYRSGAIKGEDIYKEGLLDSTTFNKYYWFGKMKSQYSVKFKITKEDNPFQAGVSLSKGTYNSYIDLDLVENVGVFKKYYRNGSIRYIQDWVNGKLHGEMIVYSRKGKIKRIKKWEYGERIKE